MTDPAQPNDPKDALKAIRHYSYDPFAVEQAERVLRGESGKGRVNVPASPVQHQIEAALAAVPGITESDVQAMYTAMVSTFGR
jgi:hypothetical protein